MLIIKANYVASGRYYKQTESSYNTIYRGMVSIAIKERMTMFGIGDHLLIEEPGINGLNYIYKSDDTNVNCNIYGALKSVIYKLQLIDSELTITIRAGKVAKIITSDYSNDYSSVNLSLSEIPPVILKSSVDIGWAFDLPQKLCIYNASARVYDSVKIENTY